MRATSAIKHLDSADPGSLDAYIYILRREISTGRLGSVALRTRVRKIPFNPDAVYCVRIVKAAVNGERGATIAFLCNGSVRVLRCPNDSFKSIIAKNPTDNLSWNTACRALSFMYTCAMKKTFAVQA